MQTDLRRPIVKTKYLVWFDDAIVSNWMLKEMAGNGFHLNIVRALGMFALANVVPRDLVDGQIPEAIERWLDGGRRGWRRARRALPSQGAEARALRPRLHHLKLKAFSQWRRAKAFSHCHRD